MKINIQYDFQDNQLRQHFMTILKKKCTKEKEWERND